MAVANAKDDDVAFVALDVFEVLDQQADELTVRLAFPFGVKPATEIVVGACLAQERLLDLALLGFRECDDADRHAALPGEQSADELGDVIRLGRVAALLINALIE